ncbi:MAG: glycerophosphodiester phosphodiesterase [Methanomicrobiaceae archaeon]|nr:glycerophosphodiester phosphodiesterase [Methanomicrobiaceae archaeon]
MQIIGHRGARAVAPENTLRAIRIGTLCADFVEVDVRLSRDGVPVVIHDATLDRTTNGMGAVRDMLFSDLQKLDAGEGERIPALSQVCATVGDDCGLVVEIKEQGTEDAICAVLAERGGTRLYIVSFHADSVVSAGVLLPEATTGLITPEGQPDPVAAARSAGAGALLPKKDILTPGLIASAHRQGLLVIPWTLNEKEEISRAYRSGVDACATDDPCRTRRIVSVLETTA